MKHVVRFAEENPDRGYDRISGTLQYVVLRIIDKTWKKEEKHMADWIDSERNLMEQFRLKTYPIGYKRFENPDDVDKIPDLRKIDHFFAFCQMIAQVRRWGLTLGTKKRTRNYSHTAQ